MAKPDKKQKDTPEFDMAADLLLKEADEALRQDKLNAMWDEWGSTIVGVALMVILGTMIGVGWQKWRTAQEIAGTKSLVVREQAPDTETKGVYGGVANMLDAAKLSMEETKNSTEITKLLTDAADSDMPREWSFLAEWGALRSRADAAADTEKSIEETTAIKIGIADDMAALARKKNNPYAPAMLMEAALLQGENGQAKTAVTLLEEAKSHPLTAGTPALKLRIDGYLQLYKSELPQ